MAGSSSFKIYEFSQTQPSTPNAFVRIAAILRHPDFRRPQCGTRRLPPSILRGCLRGEPCVTPRVAATAVQHKTRALISDGLRHAPSSPEGAGISDEAALSLAIDVPNFSKSIGGGRGPEDEKCSKCQQNPDKIGFFFRFDPFSCHHWGRPGPSKEI